MKRELLAVGAVLLMSGAAVAQCQWPSIEFGTPTMSDEAMTTRAGDQPTKVDNLCWHDGNNSPNFASYPVTMWYEQTHRYDGTAVAGGAIGWPHPSTNVNFARVYGPGCDTNAVGCTQHQLSGYHLKDAPQKATMDGLFADPGTYRLHWYMSNNGNHNAYSATFVYDTDNRGTVNIIIKDGAGNIVVGQQVDLRSGPITAPQPHGTVTVSATTDAQGRVSFPDVNKGRTQKVQIVGVNGAVVVQPGYTTTIQAGVVTEEVENPSEEEPGGEEPGGENILDADWWTDLFESLFVPTEDTTARWEAIKNTLSTWGPIGMINSIKLAWDHAPPDEQSPLLIQSGIQVRGVGHVIKWDLRPVGTYDDGGTGSQVGNLVSDMRFMVGALTYVVFGLWLCKVLLPRFRT